MPSWFTRHKAAALCACSSCHCLIACRCCRYHRAACCIRLVELHQKSSKVWVGSCVVKCNSTPLCKLTARMHNQGHQVTRLPHHRHALWKWVIMHHQHIHSLALHSEPRLSMYLLLLGAIQQPNSSVQQESCSAAPKHCQGRDTAIHSWCDSVQPCGLT